MAVVSIHPFESSSRLSDYTVVRELGRGGSGMTRLVTNPEGIERCLKEFRFGMRKGDADAFASAELFMREVKTLRSLSHPQIPGFVDAFVEDFDGEERLYLVMEYVKGADFAELMERRKFREEDALDVAKKLLPVIDYIHAFSPPIIHRDIKPSNLIETPEGAIKLVDFGSVKDRIMFETRNTFSRVGSYGFAAPELNYGKAVPASDIFGLGATLVCLLSGEPGLHKLMNNQHRLDFRGKLNVSPRTEQLLWDMTEPDLDARIKDAEALKERLYGDANIAPPAQIPDANIQPYAFRDIDVCYRKSFWRRWDLTEVLSRFGRIYEEVERAMREEYYEIRYLPNWPHIKMGMTEPSMSVAFKYINGGHASECAPDLAFKALPTPSLQKKMLRGASCEFHHLDNLFLVSARYTGRSVRVHVDTKQMNRYHEKLHQRIKSGLRGLRDAKIFLG